MRRIIATKRACVALTKAKGTMPGNNKIRGPEAQHSPAKKADNRGSSGKRPLQSPYVFFVVSRASRNFPDLPGFAITGHDYA